MTVIRTRLLPLLLALPLAGCLSLGGKAPPFLLTLTAAQIAPADQPRSAGPGDAITVYTPSTPAEIANLRVPVRTGATTVAYLKGAQWTDVPAKLFQQLLSDTLAARTGRVVLNPRQASVDPGIRLTGDLDRFGIDASARQAEVSFDAIRQNRDASRVDNRRFTARVPVAAMDPQAVAAALNQAANQVAVQVSDWLAH